MRRLIIVTGILGGGTALTFAAAVTAATLFPNGTMVTNQGAWQVNDLSWRGGGIVKGGPAILPAPAPAFPAGGAEVQVGDPEVVTDTPLPASP